MRRQERWQAWKDWILRRGPEEASSEEQLDRYRVLGDELWHAGIDPNNVDEAAVRGTPCRARTMAAQSAEAFA